MSATAGVASPQRGLIPPVVDGDSEDFWAGIAEGEIRLPRCDACATVWFPPTPGCPECGAEGFTRVAASPRGRLYSWVVVHRSLQPEFAGELPYVVATVTLDDGPKLFARLFDVRLDAIEPDMEVEAVFYEVDGFHLLGFRPLGGPEMGRS